MIITEDKVNLKRQREFDVMKVISIIAMIVIHVYEDMSLADTDVICSAPFDVILQFLGGTLAAPFFMFALGIGVSYSSHRTPKELLLRGLKLLGFSYFFNLIHYALPDFIGYCILGEIDWQILRMDVFFDDILTFAGLTFILFALLKKIKVPPIGVCAIAFVMQAVGCVISANVEATSVLGIYLSIPFVKTHFISYFPLFQWFIYPALGLLFAKYLRHITDLDKFYGGLLAFSASALASFCVALYVFNFDIRYLFTLADESFYDQTFLHVIFSILCIFIEAAVIHFIQKKVHLPKTEKLINYISSNLNNIYIIQWIIIGWAEVFIFYDENALPIKWVAPVGIVILIISCLATKLYQKIFKRQNII